ncbi:prolipoprotein diacylglyceryl transferase [Hymenobacter tenuis]
MPVVLPPSSSQTDYYLFFYVVGFGVAGALLLRAGHMRRYPWRQWLPLLAATLLSLILGTRLVAGTASDWYHLLTHAAWAGPDTRSILGGILGASLALTVLRRFLGFGREVYDAFALPLLVGLAVQGVGCLLTGCCFGTPTSGPLGICYAPGTLPFLAHAAQGLVPATAAHSAPVHPAQLYQIGLCLLISAFLCLQACRRQAPGQQFLQAILLYAAGRLGLEFLRDTAGDVLGSSYWHGLKQVQWMLLLAVAGVLGLMYYRARLGRAPSQTRLAAFSHWRARLLLGALLATTAVLSPNWLTLPEQFIIKAILLASLGLEAVLWVRGQFERPRHLAGGPVLLGSLIMLLTSQAPTPTDDRRYTTVSAGGLVGASEQYFDYPYGCSGTKLPTATYQQRFKLGSVGIARSVPLRENSVFTFGLNLGLGSTTFRSSTDSATVQSPYNGYSSTKPLFSANPYFQIENRKYLRYGIGAHIGDVAYDFAYEPGKVSNFRLQSLVELGLLRSIYLHASINYGLQGMGNGLTKVGLGTGAGQERFRLVGGIVVANSQANAGFLDQNESKPIPFLQAQIPVSDSWTVEPVIVTDFDKVRSFWLRTSLRIPSRGSDSHK